MYEAVHPMLLDKLRAATCAMLVEADMNIVGVYSVPCRPLARMSTSQAPASAIDAPPVRAVVMDPGLRRDDGTAIGTN